VEDVTSDNLASNRGAVVEQLKDLGRKGLIKVPRSKITTERDLTRDQVLDEQVWRILARHPNEVPAGFAEDKELLRKYFNKVASRTKDSKNMTLYVGDSLKDQTTLKAWYVYGLEYRSYADGGSGLVNGRLLEIAPEALSVQGKGASNIRPSYTLADLQAFDETIQGLEGTLHPDILKPLRKLRNIIFYT